MAGLQATTSDLDSDLRALIYDAFLTSGRPILRAAMAHKLGQSPGAIDASLERLAAAHMVVRQPDSGEVLMANPFSAVPTAFRVESAGLGWWANCIWDGLGISAMAMADATVLTSCPDCGEAMSVEIRDGRLVRGSGIVHFAVPAAHWWDDIVFT